jgi:hypothetical protein
MNRTEQSPAKAKRFSYSFRLVRRQRFGEYKHKEIAWFSVTFSLCFFDAGGFSTPQNHLHLAKRFP